MESCRFRTSWGGTQRCEDPVHEEGFCRFHFDCYLRGEVLASGQISERLADQTRRREINFHGIRPTDRLYVSE